MGTHHRHTMNDREFSELLNRWNSHQTLRAEGAPVTKLAESRFRLDKARDRLRTAA